MNELVGATVLAHVAGVLQPGDPVRDHDGGVTQRAEAAVDRAAVDGAAEPTARISSHRC